MIRIGVDHVGTVWIPEQGLKQRRLADTVQEVQRSGSTSCLIPLTNDADAISGAIDFYKPDIIHFCELLPEAENKLDRILRRQQLVRRRFPQVRIMRSLPIPARDDSRGLRTLELCRAFEPVSDFFLTDTLIQAEDDGLNAAQPVNGFVGITGRTCDWSTAAALAAASRIPVILAGGLSPDNVREGILAVRPAGVDSCTATNAVDENGTPVRFRKDVGRVRRFVDAARSALTRTKTRRSG